MTLHEKSRRIYPAAFSEFVMPGLVPGIQSYFFDAKTWMAGPDKPGHENDDAWDQYLR